MAARKTDLNLGLTRADVQTLHGMLRQITRNRG